jgi:hypothetical protein
VTICSYIFGVGCTAQKKEVLGETLEKSCRCTRQNGIKASGAKSTCTKMKTASQQRRCKDRGRITSRPLRVKSRPSFTALSATMQGGDDLKQGEGSKLIFFPCWHVPPAPAIPLFASTSFGSWGDLYSESPIPRGPRKAEVNATKGDDASTCNCRLSTRSSRCARVWYSPVLHVFVGYRLAARDTVRDVEMNKACPNLAKFRVRGSGFRV